MDCNVLGIDVMHTESTDKSGSYNGSSELSPCVTTPMYETRDEVDKELRGDKAEQGGEWSSVK